VLLWACDNRTSSKAKNLDFVDLVYYIEESSMAEPFEYISQARLVYKDGYRNAYLGEVETPVVYGVQGKLREYYGAKEGTAIASTLDHIVAAVAG
jgi:hypothetical protein